jgi:hypothetical protein
MELSVRIIPGISADGAVAEAFWECDWFFTRFLSIAGKGGFIGLNIHNSFG